MYKRVERHLSEEDNMLIVVWHMLQEEFVKTYRHYTSLIAQCYRDPNIHLEFTIEELLEYFTNIAP